jgi:S1-C subfamily serine protease
MARNVMDQLVSFGTVKRGLLGVTTHNVTPEIAQIYGLPDSQGALVSQVVEGSAAEKAGIHTGDVIASINGQHLKSNSELRIVISQLRAGQKVDVGLIRDGKPQKVVATIMESSSNAAPQKETTPKESNDINSGFEGASLSDAPDGGGVMVKNVEAGSAAAQNGLRSGDIIVGANRAKVTGLPQLRDKAKGAAALVLEVRRGKTVLLVPLRAQ